MLTTLDTKCKHCGNRKGEHSGNGLHCPVSYDRNLDLPFGERFLLHQTFEPEEFISQHIEAVSKPVEVREHDPIFGSW